MRSITKTIPSISATPSSPISVRRSQEIEAIHEISPSPTLMEIQGEKYQASNSMVKKSTKLQKLKEQLKEYRVLDRHLKQENMRLKEQFHKEDQKVVKLKKDKKILLKKAHKWYRETQSLYRRNLVLKIKLLQKKHRHQQATSTSHLDLLAHVAQEA